VLLVCSSPNWESAEPAAWAVATSREAIIRPLAEGLRITREAADAAAATLGISRSLLYRLVARFRARPQTSTLLPRKRGLRLQTPLLAPPLEQLIGEAIAEVYLQPERPRISYLMTVIAARCHERGLSAPSFRTIKRRLDHIDPKTLARRRLGARIARERFGPVQESTLSPDLPLEVVQIDHTPVDIVIVDEQSRQPIGRPWLTLAIDVASRVVLGLSVSLDAPSTVSVALVLTHAVLPKELWLADRELDVPWPVFGIPDTLHVDNGREFHSLALTRGAEEYGIRVTFRPPARPYFGGHIERLIGTVMGAVHLLPGTTFSNVAEKGDYNAEARAALTLPELERWLALEIAGVYHQSVHTALGTSPLAAWRAGLARRAAAPRQPTDRQTFFLDFLPGERRLVRRDGIQLFRLHYWDNVLSPWAGRSREPMLVKYNPRNLSRIYLRDAHGAYWPIPYRRLGQPAISLWEHRAAMTRLQAAGHRAIDDTLIFKSVEEQRAIVDSARRTTTQQRRALARRPRDAAALGPPLRTDPRDEPDYSHLPPYPVEEWE
jgi:putative transposase